MTVIDKDFFEELGRAYMAKHEDKQKYAYAKALSEMVFNLAFETYDSRDETTSEISDKVSISLDRGTLIFYLDKSELEHRAAHILITNV